MKEIVYSGEAALNASKVAAESSHSSARPSLGFPIGTALLLLVVFLLSGVISCCYHWEKLRFFRGIFGRRSPDADLDGADGDGGDDPPSKSNRFHEDEKRHKGHSLPVIMPGDRVPTFIAWHCPHVPPPSLPPPLPSPPAPPLPSSPVKVVVVDVELSPPSRELPLPSETLVHNHSQLPRGVNICR